MSLSSHNNNGRKPDFKPNQFDPILLLSQMIAFQSINYTSLGLLFLILNLLVDSSRVTFIKIFDLSNFEFSTSFFFTYGIIYLIHTIPSMLALLYIVERAKLCMDFVITYHFWHFVFSGIYCNALPFSIMSFCLFSFTALLITLGGEYLCMNREIRPIQLTGAASNRRNAGNGSLDGASGSHTYQMVSENDGSRDKYKKRRDSNEQIQVIVMGDNDPIPESYELSSLNTLISRGSSPSLSHRGSIDYE